MTPRSRAALKLRSAVSTWPLREKCSRAKPLSAALAADAPSSIARLALWSEAAWRCAAERIMPG